MKKHRLLLLSFTFTFSLMVLTTAWIGRGIYRLGYLQMDMDEALHAIRGLNMASDILGGDWREFGQDFIKPDWYPPGHGVLSGVWMSLLGPRIETIRLYSAFCYLLFGLLLFWSAHELLPRANPFVYLLPTLFLITDSQFSVHAGLSMLELPAITFAFAGLLFLNRALRRNSLADHLMTLLFGLLCLFTKYNYGLAVFAVIAISHALRTIEYFKEENNPPKDPQAMMHLLMFWGLFALVVALWFVTLGQWRWLSAYAGAQPEHYALWSRANLGYYPRLLWNESLNWLAILLSIGGAIQLVRKHQYVRGLTPYLLFFGISLVMLTLVLQNNSRFAMILFPPLWITATVGAHKLIVEFPSEWLRGASYGLLFIGMLLAGVTNYYSFQSRLFTAYENTNAGVDQAYQFIADVLGVSNQQDLQIVMLGRTDQWNGQALQFHLEAICLRSGNHCHIGVKDSRTLRKGWPEKEYPADVQQQRIKQALEAADYRIHFYDRPEHPEGWALIAEREFTFERLNKKAKVVWVSIYEP